jgi:hypothetical protein
MTSAITPPTMHGMSPPPDQPPPSSPPEKPNISREERWVREADRLTSIRLRMAIGHALDDREITTPAAIGEALGRLWSGGLSC